MNYFFIALIWLLALNTVRLFLREVRKRQIEEREWRAPNMLPNDFIVRDTVGEMGTPFIVMLISTGILTVILLNKDWIESRNSYLILISLSLTFIISGFIATDRITWWATVRNNSIKMNFLNIDFADFREVIPVENITIQRRNNGTITLFNNEIRLFSVYTTSESYDLMVDFLQKNEVLESTFMSRNVEEEMPKEEASEFEKVAEEIVVQRSKRSLWLFLVTIY